MPYAGQTFKNPRTGEEVEFLQTAKETAGEFVRFRSLIRPGGGFSVMHRHLAADEHFEVLSGTLTYMLNGQMRKVNAGESVLLPKNQPHNHFNADDNDLVMVQTISPAGDADLFLESLFGLAADGKLDKAGQPSFLQIMVWITELQNKTYLAALPIGLQNVLAALLSPLAHWLGYRSFYPEYQA